MSTLLAALRENARDAPALACGAHSLSHAALLAAADTLAEALAARGVAPGDRVRIELGNEPAHLVAVLGVQAARAIAVPLDPRAGARRRARIQQRTKAVLALVAQGAAAEAAEAPAAALGLDGTAVVLGSVRCAAAPPSEAPAAGDPAVIRFTSGSTGEPRGALLDHAAPLAGARLLAEAFALEADHRELALAPLVHSGAWQRAAATLLAGGCVLLPEPASSLGPAALLDDLTRLGVHGCYAPPPLWRMLLRAPETRARTALAGKRTLEVGSAPIAAHELERLLELAPAARVHVHYGLTECTRATLLDVRARPDALGSVGRAAAGVELAVIGQDGAPGAPGEIRVRGPQLARGYWDDEAATAERFRDGWLATGDIGQLDREGFLYFRGRLDDRIDCGGHGVYPAEIEAELGALPGVREWLVAGVPDPRGVLGEVPWLLAVPESPARFNPATLLALARRRLPSYMVPRRVLAVPSLPRSGPGKLDRRGAVELYARGSEE